MEVIKFIQSFSNPFLDYFFTFITYIGGTVFGIAFSLFMFWCKDKRLGYKFLYALLFSFTLNNFLKCIFNFKRPIGIEGIKSNAVNTATGSSFPSGHSQFSGTTFTLLIKQYKNKFVFIFSVFMMLMIPISRLYLGVHWPRDVLFGTIIGILSALFADKLFEKSFDNSKSLIILSFIVFLLLGVFVVHSNDFNKSLGAFLGLIISIVLESKFINFDPKGTLNQNIIKCIIGLSGALIIYIGFKIFLNNDIFTFLKYFLIVFWIMFISPYLFIKLNLAKKSNI